MKTRILLISDISFQIEHFLELFEEKGCNSFAQLSVFCSPGSEPELSKLNPKISSMDININVDHTIESYDLIISYHCRQLFPKKLVDSVRCINIHPGFNPFNRGWYPGVFSIANGYPAGATIHEMDEKIDHGPVIAQQRVEILPEDTSGSVYAKIIHAEHNLLQDWFVPMITGSYSTYYPGGKSNLNCKKDYENLKKLDMDETVRTGDLINRLRALTHEPYKNAYFIDKETGRKIFVSIILTRE